MSFNYFYSSHITRASIQQAAWYPNKPSSQDKEFMTNFVNALAKFYPCSWCATDFQKNVKSSPPK